MIKKLGIPKEVKQDEGRVALIPEHITQYTGLADIFVETEAGVGSGFTDEDYKKYLNLSSTVASRVENAIDINIKSMADFQHVKGLGKEALKKIYLLAKDDVGNYSAHKQQNLFED